MTKANADMSMSKIYPDKHNALSLVGQFRPGAQMCTLRAILKDITKSGPIRLAKQSRQKDKQDTFFIVKYANLGKGIRPINQVIKRLLDAYRLKWLRPRVVYSQHTNLQENLLGDLRRKLLWGIVDADLGQCPCNCPCRFKVNGECAYGGDDTCRTSGTMYKVTCKANEN
jgi:hypothetical protein